ncbi:MAG TPA: hypothetical protein VG389_19020 [Myxococcota bacterium]|nr:hypothetical protein [Myxococcota bacterium]
MGLPAARTAAGLAPRRASSPGRTPGLGRVLALTLALAAAAGCRHRPDGDAAPPDARAAGDAGTDAAPLGTDAAPPPACAVAVTACNGDDALCDRAYDDVTYPTTHNAMSNDDEGWLIPNQHHGITRQLADGVRGLMLDVHPYLGGTYLCHGVCSLGNEPLADGLSKVRAFLEVCPREVVSLIFESYVPAADVAAAFAASGLDAYVWTQAAGAPWPTLREMIDGGARLVAFTDYDAGAPAWYHDVWAFAWETPYAFDTPADFTCAMNRGVAGNPLFILNHFLTNPLASPANAEMVNYDPLFLDRALACQAASGALPNFPTVDFYDIGDLFTVAATLNGTL